MKRLLVKHNCKIQKNLEQEFAKGMQSIDGIHGNLRYEHCNELIGEAGKDLRTSKY